MDNQPRRFDQVVRDRRKALNMTQVRLAELVGVGQPTISAWEGGSSRPALAQLAKLATVLEVDLYELTRSTGDDDLVGFLDAVIDAEVDALGTAPRAEAPAPPAG